jgi:hypothetical protein
MYGLSDKIPLSDKDQTRQKTANVLLPLSYVLYANDNKIDIPYVTTQGIGVLRDGDLVDFTHYDTEQSISDTQTFVNAPPNDIMVYRERISLTVDEDENVTMSTYTQKKFVEVKVVLYKGKDTEIIIRQDFYALNLLASILKNNPNFKIEDLSESSLIETPFMLVLMWKEEDIHLDMVCFSDVALLKRIHMGKTSRCKEGMKLVSKNLTEYNTSGKITYKCEKSSVVAHLKISFFPFRGVDKITSEHTFKVKSMDLVLQPVNTEKNLWVGIEIERLKGEFLSTPV